MTKDPENSHLFVFLILVSVEGVGALVAASVGAFVALATDPLALEQQDLVLQRSLLLLRLLHQRLLLAAALLPM